MRGKSALVSSPVESGPGACLVRRLPAHVTRGVNCRIRMFLKQTFAGPGGWQVRGSHPCRKTLRTTRTSLTQIDVFEIVVLNPQLEPLAVRGRSIYTRGGSRPGFPSWARPVQSRELLTATRMSRGTFNMLSKQMAARVARFGTNLGHEVEVIEIARVRYVHRDGFAAQLQLAVDNPRSTANLHLPPKAPFFPSIERLPIKERDPRRLLGVDHGRRAS